MQRNGQDGYINSNHIYNASSQNIASYTNTDGSGIGRLSFSGGYLQWYTYDGNVTAGNSYSLTERFRISPAGVISATNGYFAGPATGLTGVASSLSIGGSAGYLSAQGIGAASMNLSAGTYTNGVYRNENGLGGNYAYSPVLHMSTSDTHWQLQAQYGTGATQIHYRSGINGSYGSWHVLVDDANYNNFTPSLTGTASGLTAGYATQWNGLSYVSGFSLNTNKKDYPGNGVYYAATQSDIKTFLGLTTGNWVDLTSTQDITGQKTLLGDNQRLVLKNGTTGNALFIDFKNASGAEDAFLGYGSNVQDFSVYNNRSGGALKLYSSGVLRYTIDASGNNTWTGSGSFGGDIVTNGSGTRQNTINQIDIGRSGGDYGTIGYNVGFTSTAATWNYRVSDYSSLLRFQQGGLQLWTAPSGTAGSPMSATNVFSVSQSGIATASRYMAGANGFGMNSNYQWDWSTGPRAYSDMSLRIWDQYSNYGGSGYPTTYGTILHITGRSGHLDAQWYMGESGQLLYRKAFYGENSWSNWQTIWTNTNMDAPNKAGTSYYQTNTWMQFNGTYGLYWPSPPSDYNTIPHIHMNSEVTYGTFAFRGSKNNYTGIWWTDGASSVSGMFDGSGNGGDYDPSTGWHYYWNRANSCLGIGGSPTTAGYRAQINGAALIDGDVKSNGTVTASSFFEVSDTTLKRNIRPVTYGMKELDAIESIAYELIADPAAYTHIGIKAQEVQKVLPEIVRKDNKGKLAVSYVELIPVLMNAIKELKLEVGSLKQLLNESMKN